MDIFFPNTVVAYTPIKIDEIGFNTTHVIITNEFGTWEAHGTEMDFIRNDPSYDYVYECLLGDVADLRQKHNM